MTDYLETSGNLQKPAMEVFGRFPVGFRQVSGRFPDVSEFVIDGPHGIFIFLIIFFKFFFIDKKFRKSAGNRGGQFLEVSRGFQIIHH